MSAARSQFLKGIILVLVALWAAPLWADPLPGQTLKFQQLPLNNGVTVPAPIPPANPPSLAPYTGHDTLSTAFESATGSNFWRGHFAADDFGDTVSTQVVHVRWWGSYLPSVDINGFPVQNYRGNSNLGAQKFLIAFESDVPVGPGNTFSTPGSVLSSEIVNFTNGPILPTSGTFKEKVLNNSVGVPEHIYEYNAELAVPFSEVAHSIYWLKIVALVDPSTEGQIQWGWHNRDWSIPDPYATTTPNPAIGLGESNIGPAASPVWHFQDDAVIGDVDVQFAPGTPFPLTVTQPQLPPFQPFQPLNYSAFLGDGPTFIDMHSMDLAFELYTPVPEPSTFVLGGMAMIGLVVARRRMRR